MKRLLPAVLAGAALMLSSASFAAPALPDLRPAEATSPPAKADALKALAGEWRAADALMGFSEPRLNEVVGHLYLQQNGGPFLHELWVIKAKGDSLAVMQNFFNPDLTPRGDGKWTERRLVAIDEKAGRFYFDNMTLTATRDTLQLAVKGAAPNPIVFNFTRVK